MSAHSYTNFEADLCTDVLHDFLCDLLRPILLHSKMLHNFEASMKKYLLRRTTKNRSRLASSLHLETTKYYCRMDFQDFYGRLLLFKARPRARFLREIFYVCVFTAGTVRCLQ